MNNDVFHLGIIGSRSFTDYDLFKSKISQVVKKLQAKCNKIIFVSGAAKGADSFARDYAKENKIEIIEFIPDWDKLGKSAGFLRNKDIVDKSDLLVAFWDGKSKGTFHSMKLMNIKQQNRLIIVRPTNRVEDNVSVKGISEL